MGRIFSVRVNIDDLSASLDMWPTDQERSAWLRGFTVGARGGASRWQSGTPESDGFTVGQTGYADSLAWRDKKIAAGVQSAKAREEKKGTADPRANREQIVNSVPVVLEHYTNAVRTACEPNQSSSQPVIQSSIQAVNESTKESAGKPAFADAQFDIFWNSYGKKTGKTNSIKEWKKLSQSERDEAITGIASYSDYQPESKYRLDPERYLNRKKWTDELICRPVNRAESDPTFGFKPPPDMPPRLRVVS